MRKKIKKFSVVVLIMSLLSSCNGCNTGDDENQLKDGRLIVNENKNVINLAVTSFDSLHPIMTKSASIAEFMKTVCEPLFEYDEAGNPVEVLAENYAVSSDGLMVSFDVKPVEFHDSTLVSAKDVVYTIKMIRNNDTLYSDCAKYIKDVYSESDGRVYIKLIKPVINFAGMLNFPIIKKGTPTETNQNYVPIGTGPCKYYGKTTSNQITFSANEEWHEGETGFKDIVINLLKDDFTVLHSFDVGEVDVVASELTESEEFTPRSEHIVNEYVANSLVFLGINNTVSKLSGKSTRKAIELLCDKEKIIDVDVYSKGKSARVPINPSMWFYPDLPDEESEYENVKAILEQDGWIKNDNLYYRDYKGSRQNLDLRILVNNDNEEKVKIAQDIADSLTAFGINTLIKSVNFETYRNCVREKNYDLFIGEVLMDKSMDPRFLTNSAGNYFGYVNQTMDGILLEMAKTSDGNEIKNLAQKYGVMFNDEVPFVPLFFRTENVIYNKYISGISSPTSYQIYKDIDKWYISKTK